MRGTDKQQRKVRPHQSPAVTAAPLFVTFGDISPRRGENLSLPGEAFMRKVDFRAGRALAILYVPACTHHFYYKALRGARQPHLA